MSKVDLSVVIPVYNRSRELQRALDALMRQTARNFEVIVCDDGSSEDIAAVVRPYREHLALQYLRIENSGGPARPRNAAIRMAQGEWIAFLDSDDWWDDGRVAAVSLHLTSEVDLLYHPLRIVTAPGVHRRVGGRGIVGDALSGDPLCQMLTQGNPIPNSSVVMRRSVLQKLGGVSEDPALLGVAEDFDTWLRLVEQGGTIRYLPQILGSYWVGADGLSALSLRHVRGLQWLYDCHERFIPAACRETALSCQAYTLGSALMRLGEECQSMARLQLRRAVRLPTLRLRLLRRLRLLVLNWSLAWRQM